MKADDKAITIDANVILRYLLKDNSVLSPKAKQTIDAMDDGKITLLCDPVTLAEVVWVMTSFYNMPPNVIESHLTPLVGAPGFAVANKEHYLRALKLFASSIPHFGDACACAAALETADGRLLSFDRKLSRVPGIRRLEKAVC